MEGPGPGTPTRSRDAPPASGERKKHLVLEATSLFVLRPSPPPIWHLVLLSYKSDENYTTRRMDQWTWDISEEKVVSVTK